MRRWCGEGGSRRRGRRDTGMAISDARGCVRGRGSDQLTAELAVFGALLDSLGVTARRGRAVVRKRCALSAKCRMSS
jgi:hypothetical protein